MVDEGRLRVARQIAVGSLVTALIIIVPSLLIFLLRSGPLDFLLISLIIAAPILVIGLGLAARIRWG